MPRTTPILSVESVANADESVLRAAVHALCKHDAKVHSRLATIIYSISQSTTNSFGNKKRKLLVDVTKHLVCGQCKQTFHSDSNNNGKRPACRYHSGELEVDYDLWPDHNEKYHGPINTSFHRKEYPDQFVWNCCDEPGNEPGCRRSRHRTKDDERFKADDTSEEEEGGEENEKEQETDEDHEEEDEEDYEDYYDKD
ncbi:hypothetical protein QBC43DRAFT_264369 [Cladorrhinum sp. PSN259]|nr:hypothetical protein QBC43DRAFT_264369 [Cladorrhinum sp. PSN259]